MFGYYKDSKEDFKEVYKTTKKILNGLVSDGLLTIHDLQNYTMPNSQEQIIPKIEVISKNYKLATNSIADKLGLVSFLLTNKSSDGSCFVHGDDFIIINKIYFTTNPLSRYSLNLANKLEEYAKEELLFSEIGYISKKELSEIKGYGVKGGGVFGPLKTELIFNNILIECVKKNARSLNVCFVDGIIKIGMTINGSYIEKNLSSSSAPSFSSFSLYIESMFNKGILYKRLFGKKYKLSLTKNKATSEFGAINVLDIDIFDFESEPSKFSRINLYDSIKRSFNESLESPSGMVVVSSVDELSEIMYSVLNELIKNKTNSKIYSIETIIRKKLKNVVQLDKTSATKWQDLDFSSYGIILMNEVDSSLDFETLLNFSSQGKFVIVGVHSNSSIEAFSKILRLTKNKEILSDNLLGILHVDGIEKVCEYCSTDVEFFKHSSYSKFTMFETAPSATKIIKVENKFGCSHCINGYSNLCYIAEYLENDSVLNSNILEGFDIKSLRIEKTNNFWKTTFESSIPFLCDGILSINSIIKKLGGSRK